MTTVAELPAGFADKVLSAQSTFRSVMDAMARPGSVQRIVAAGGTPGAMMRGTAAIALTLFDHDTPIWLDPLMSETSNVTKWLKFHTGAPVVGDSTICSFALIGDPAALPALDRFSFGTNEYPDRSTTLILQVESLTQGRGLELRGPGIDGTARLQAAIEPADLLVRLAINAALFPRGIDVVLVHDDTIVAIPRTTRLSVKGG
jgi:alpha-D-ribose 1-methylphosphonate 5-triphosphate synthase subunit PhnH